MWMKSTLLSLKNMQWPSWLQPYVEVLLLWISWAIDYVDWDYLEVRWNILYSRILSFLQFLDFDKKRNRIFPAFSFPE